MYKITLPEAFRYVFGNAEMPRKCGDLINDPWPFLLAWIVSSILAIVIPRSRWNNNKDQYYQNYGYAIDYEQQQRAYEEAQNANNGYYSNWRAGPTCSWWQYRCRKNQWQYQQYSNSRDDAVYVPNWYRFLGGQTEEERRQKEENGMETGQSAPLNLIYIWMLLMFIGIVFYGAFVLIKRQPTNGLRMTLFLYANFALMSLVMVGQGVIETDGAAIEDSIYGWYGQVGVLMAYSNFWYIIYCAIFMIALTVRTHLLKRRVDNYTAPKMSESSDSEGSYQLHDAPGARGTV